jgi:hypothetical protein
MIMSIDHSHQITEDERCKVCLNISGIDSEARDVEFVSGSIYAFNRDNGTPRFTCNVSIRDLQNLYGHLGKYSMIRSGEIEQTGKFVEISCNAEQIIALLSESNPQSLISALTAFISKNLSHDDLNTILGRKESLAEYKRLLNMSDEVTEPEWQRFFERNEWIFGYGLKYKYLKILQREAHISSADIDGSNSVIADFLLSDNKFTKLIELKKPTTPLFKEYRNRSDAWCLSSELSDAVSQILAQKANWDIHAQSPQFNGNGDRIAEATHDVECILIIGNRSSVTGTDRERAMKFKTLELYRRNLRNIDIIFYDELLERAEYIVSSK